VTHTIKLPTPAQVLSIALTDLVNGYQNRLVVHINNERHPRQERDGLCMALALFRAELIRLGIANMPSTQTTCDDSVCDAN
jgi:hypothetical protein